MLMAGDNVYGDVRGNDITPLVDAYRRQLTHPQFAAARRTLPMFGIWDDHDYGRNDAGVELAAKTETAKLFREFWQIEPASQPAEAGVYYSRMFGPADRRVQILFLDTRTFRAPLKPKTDTFPHWGKYEPDSDPAKTMLGEAQWAWLAAKLKTPAHVRILVSSIQVIADGHGFERWGNLPRERDRLLELVRTASGRTVLVSGDRHMGALYAKTSANADPIPELTTSSLNKSFGPSRDAPTPELKSPLYHPENFGLVEINWKEGTVLLRLMDIGGGTVAALSTPLWRTP